MYSASVIVLLISAFCLAARAAPKANHDFIDCPLPYKPNKYPIRDSVQLDATVLPPVVDTARSYPELGEMKPVDIACIRVINRDENAKRGYVEVVHGGRKFQEVKLKFWSQPFQPIHFDVEIHFECVSPYILC